MITEGYKGVWWHLLSAKDEYKETVETFYFLSLLCTSIIRSHPGWMPPRQCLSLCCLGLVCGSLVG